jgi:hypothetical protein
LLVFPPSRQSGGQHGLQGGGVEAPRQVLVSATVLGEGALYVNGSPVGNASLLLRPGVVSLEARPASGWRLKQLLVNGSPGVADWLRIRGNTSVVAIFEHAMVRVTLESSPPGAKLVLGGMEVELPRVLEVAYGSVVELSAEPSPGFRLERVLVNGSEASLPLRFEARGDTRVVFIFSKLTAPVEVFNPANLTLRVEALWGKPGNWTRVGSWELNSSAVLEVPLGSYLRVTGFCKRFNETLYLCYTYATVQGAFLNPFGEPFNASYSVWNGSQTWYPLAGRVSLSAGWILRKTNMTAPVVEVWVSGKLQQVQLYLVPVTRQVGRIEYRGNGTIYAVGSLLDFYIPIPENYSTVVIEGVAYLPVEGCEVDFSRVYAVDTEIREKAAVVNYRVSGVPFHVVFKDGRIESVPWLPNVYYYGRLTRGARKGWVGVGVIGGEVTFKVYVYP